METPELKWTKVSHVAFLAALPIGKMLDVQYRGSNARISKYKDAYHKKRVSCKGKERVSFEFLDGPSIGRIADLGLTGVRVFQAPDSDNFFACVDPNNECFLHIKVN